MSSIIQAGFLQTDPEFGAVDKNLSHAKQLWGNRKADLLVLPELFNTGYQFRSLEEARNLSEPIPGGPTTGFLMDWARASGLVIVAGLAEREGYILYNSAARRAFRMPRRVPRPGTSGVHPIGAGSVPSCSPRS